jgi:hypothetical protein
MPVQFVLSALGNRSEHKQERPARSGPHASLPIDGSAASFFSRLDFLQGFRDSAYAFFAADKSKASD